MKRRWSRLAAILAILASVCGADELTAACVDQTMLYSSDSEAPSVSNARPSVVMVGSSTAEGYYGPSVHDSGYVWRLASLLLHRKPGECLTNLAVQGYTTFDARSTALPAVLGQDTANPSRNIDHALDLRPALVVVHLPTNDAAGDIPFETSRANLLDMVHRVDSAGARILLVGPSPRNDLQASQVELLLQWKRFFDTLSIAEVVNPWDSVADASDTTRLDPAVDYGDGIHLNDSGQAILFRMVARSRTWRGFVPGSWNASDSFPVGAVDSFAMPLPGAYIQGAHLDFTANFSRSVTVPDTAAIRLTIGANHAFAKYDSGSGTPRIRFRYTVQPGDLDSGGILVARWIGSPDSSVLDSLDRPCATNIVSVDPMDSIRIVANRPPFVAISFRDTIAPENFGHPLSYPLDPHFGDSDGIVSSYRLSGDSTVVRYALVNDTLRISSRPNTVGKDVLVVTAMDNLGATISDTFAIAVWRVNKAPTVTVPLHDTVVAENSTKPILLPLSDHFQDSDGTISSYRISGDSSHLRYSLLHDTLRLVALSNAWGTTTIVVTATDDSGASVSDTFDATIEYTTSIEPAKPRTPTSFGRPNPVDFAVSSAIADRISSAISQDVPQLGPASRGVCTGTQGCSSLDARFNATGSLWVSIFDNLGNPVLAGSWRIGPSELQQMPRGPGGSSLDAILWNQRDSRGKPVSTGVYLWKVGFLPDSGTATEAVFRLGIRP